MNEQNINNIIAYLQKNPTAPVDVMVQNLIKTGFPEADINEALARQGVLPISTPTEAEAPKAINVTATDTIKDPTIPDIGAKKPFPKKLIIIAVGGIIIVGGLIYGGMRYFTNSKTSTVTTTTPTKIPTKKPTPTIKKISFTNPTNKIKEKLNFGTYKITIEQTTPSTEEPTVSQTIYYEKDGQIIRFEHASGALVLVKDEGIYTTDSLKKTYKAYEPPKYPRETVLQALHKLTIIDPLIENTDKGTYLWSAGTDSEWKTTDPETNHTYAATIDPNTGILTSLKESDEAGIVLTANNITIESATITPEMTEIPTGYKLVKSAK